MSSVTKRPSVHVPPLLSSLTPAPSSAASAANTDPTAHIDPLTSSADISAPNACAGAGARERAGGVEELAEREDKAGARERSEEGRGGDVGESEGEGEGEGDGKAWGDGVAEAMDGLVPGSVDAAEAAEEAMAGEAWGTASGEGGREQRLQAGKGEGSGRSGAIFLDGTMSVTDLLCDVSFQVYVGVHVLALLTLLCIPATPRLLLLALFSYALRMLGITAGYHRLLSHRSFKTSRAGQFLFALLGCLSFQKGPLWWASHHRHHHRTADTAEDAHSPLHWGFFWSHMGWFLCSTRHTDVLWHAIPDLSPFPELHWLDSYHFVPPLSLAVLLWATGGIAAFGWGFCVATVVCWHFTYCINSLAHLVGSRRFRCEFNTHCDARNNLALALATLGEGWHNNHHCYMRSAKHGFYPEEIDITWYILCCLERLGLVWDLHLPPLDELEARWFDNRHLQCRCHSAEKDMRDTITSSTLLAADMCAGTDVLVGGACAHSKNTPDGCSKPCSRMEADQDQGDSTSMWRKYLKWDNDSIDHRSSSSSSGGGDSGAREGGDDAASELLTAAAGGMTASNSVAWHGNRDSGSR
ncbi:unnamed protein product [Closterium sp. Naga37s-1]|nr:unnamed protein product [Closterium sp. Naga37s-1]